MDIVPKLSPSTFDQAVQGLHLINTDNYTVEREEYQANYENEGVVIEVSGKPDECKIECFFTTEGTPVSLLRSQETEINDRFNELCEEFKKDRIEQEDV